MRSSKLLHDLAVEFRSAKARAAAQSIQKTVEAEHVD